MPRRNSLAEKKLKGTDRNDRAVDVARADGSLSEPPAHLTDEQSAMWRWAIEHAPRGVLHAIDEATLEDWVCARVVLRAAYAIVERDGQIIYTPNGCAQKHPALATIVQASKILHTAASRLGFDPVSRTKVIVEPQKTEEELEEERKWDRLTGSFKATVNKLNGRG